MKYIIMLAMVFATACSHKKTKVEDSAPPPQASHEEMYGDTAAEPVAPKPKAKKKVMTQKKKTTKKY